MSDSRGSPGCSPPVAASQSTRHLRLLWVNLEGFILDAPYLASLQRRFLDHRRICSYGAATPDLSAPAVEWRATEAKDAPRNEAISVGGPPVPVPSEVAKVVCVTLLKN